MMSTTMENKKATENKRLTTIPNTTVDTDTILGSGKVTGILGKGGFATVYEIWNPKLEIKRAVKLWHPDTSEKSLERFETEIKITAKLHHPNIVEIHNVGEWNGLPYIEIEKINGFCLKEIIAQNGALPVEVGTAISILICRALTYAHRQNYTLYGIKRKGIVHCDIKPANIMITRRGIVKLTDFGLATPTDETLHLEEDKVNGSIHYSSPEQLQSIQVDQRTDIYSLGVVMYEMFSGTKAFSAQNLEDLIHKRLKDTYTPFHEVCRELNPALKKIVKKCMAPNRDDRYESAQELLVDIERFFYKLTKDTPERVIYHFFSNTEGYRDRNHRSKKITIAIVASFILAIGLFFAFYSVGVNFSNNTESAVDDSSTRTSSNQYTKQGTTISTTDISQKSKPRATKNVTTFSKTPPTALNNEKKKNAVSFEALNSLQAVKDQHAFNRNTQDAATDETFLQQISVAIQKADYTKAEQLFKTTTLNDGEYFFLYSQLLSYKGKWQEGLTFVDKGLRATSKRLTPDQHRSLYLSSKARCLTAAFNASGSKEQGEKAMEAWFDVKYMLKGMPSNPQYEFADSEIRRINKALQDVTSN
jgi:serine/threonine protein kinase